MGILTQRIDMPVHPRAAPAHILFHLFERTFIVFRIALIRKKLLVAIKQGRVVRIAPDAFIASDRTTQIIHDLIHFAEQGFIAKERFSKFPVAFDHFFIEVRVAEQPVVPDPVNMAGFMIENIKNGLVKQWYYEDLGPLLKSGKVTLLDTRTPAEFNS